MLLEGITASQHHYVGTKAKREFYWSQPLFKPSIYQEEIADTTDISASQPLWLSLANQCPSSCDRWREREIHWACQVKALRTRPAPVLVLSLSSLGGPHLIASPTSPAHWRTVFWASFSSKSLPVHYWAIEYNLLKAILMGLAFQRWVYGQRSLPDSRQDIVN